MSVCLFGIAIFLRSIFFKVPTAKAFMQDENNVKLSSLDRF